MKTGILFSGWQQTYTYGNEMVRVEIKVEGGTVGDDISVELKEQLYTYCREDVDEDFSEHVAGFFSETYELRLDFNKDDE